MDNLHKVSCRRFQDRYYVELDGVKLGWVGHHKEGCDKGWWAVAVDGGGHVRHVERGAKTRRDAVAAVWAAEGWRV